MIGYCESYIERVLRGKGFKIVAIVARDQYGYDIEAYHPPKRIITLLRLSVDP
jgi:hypothetical protein